MQLKMPLFETSFTASMGYTVYQSSYLTPGLLLRRPSPFRAILTSSTCLSVASVISLATFTQRLITIATTPVDRQTSGLVVHYRRR